ncbi:hypothetical protein M8J76_015759 [Diaphorina citri]|nr:hypothetical protein M8J76_015759 [Diaphorina citri]
MGAPGFSHHDLLYVAFDLRCPKSKSTVITYKDYKNMDIEKLHEDFSRVDWNTLYEMQSVNEKVGFFSQIIHNLSEKHAPLKQCRVKRPPAPWLTDDIRACMKARDRAHVKFRKNKASSDWERYRSLRNKCNRLCRDARTSHIAQNVSKGTPSSIWSFLNGLGVGGEQGSAQDCTANLDELNTHFTTSPVQVDNTTKVSTLQRISSLPKPNCSPFVFGEVTPKETRSKILV